MKGKRNGKGQTYYEGKLIFEDEYSDGKQSKGKVFDEKGNMIHEMKNINGKGEKTEKEKNM